MNLRSVMVGACVAAMAAGGASAGPAGAAPKTRSCATVRVTLAHGAHGSAKGIRATGIGCGKARTVVRSCLRDSLRGWRVSRSPSPDDRDPEGLVGLDRGGAHVSFQIAGRGGCG